jgi:hypothetical protein
MIHKEFASGGILPTSGELRVDRRVLDIFMPEPVFDEGQVCLGIKKIRGHGVLEAVELLLFRWQACSLPIDAYRTPQCAPINRYPAVGDEEMGDESVRLRSYERSNLITSGCRG